MAVQQHGEDGEVRCAGVDGRDARHPVVAM
jgi:hypothetical protein